MKLTKKHLEMLILPAAVLMLTPLVVYAVMYTSEKRTNRFQPATVDIAVQEGNKQGETLENSFTLDENNETDKPVQILDTRTNPEEKLRVCLLPEIQKDDAVCGILDFTKTSFDNNVLTFQNTDETTDATIKVVLTLDENWEDNGWKHQQDGGLHYFYYSGELHEDKRTPQLLKSVKMIGKLEDGQKLHIQVIADAIQGSGDAADVRVWNDTP